MENGFVCTLKSNARSSTRSSWEIHAPRDRFLISVKCPITFKAIMPTWLNRLAWFTWQRCIMSLRYWPRAFTYTDFSSLALYWLRSLDPEIDSLSASKAHRLGWRLWVRWIFQHELLFCADDLTVESEILSPAELIRLWPLVGTFVFTPWLKGGGGTR